LNTAARSNGGPAPAVPAGSVEIRPGPFVKWAGGKSRLLSAFDRLLPPGFDPSRGRYFEPFVGGGALFFHLAPARAVLSDSNPELVNCYQVVRDRVEELIALLREHKNDRQHFYKVRSLSPAGLSAAERAARLIFLNKTCFNGLYRVNSRGEFNVPFGRYDNPRICDGENLRAVSARLRDVEILCLPFEQTVRRAKAGDFVYLDPPYQPVSATANFTGYTATAFGDKDQERLAAVFSQLSKRGCLVMLSNSDSPVIRELYKDFRIAEVKASRAINCKAERRGRVSELVIMNYKI